MTFAAFEESAIAGAPVELFEIRLGSTIYRLTSAEDDYVLGGDVYESAEVGRSRVVLSAERDQDLLSVELPSSQPFPLLYVNIVPGQRATLTIRRVHREDPDQEAIVLFKGIVQAVAYSNDGTSARLAVAPLTRGLSRTIPRITYQGLCNHILYDDQCKVLQSSFQFTGVVSAILGSQITLPGISANGSGWATAGFVQLGTTDFRLVLNHVGDVLTLLLPFASSPLGQSVDAFAGCAHSLSVCKLKFNNVINYGGFAFVPLKDIFATGIV